MDKNVSRRRGTVLENAILDQTYFLLQEMGYRKLSMNDVAHAAKTSKNVIYRRWPLKCYLVMAAVRHQIPLINFEITDHGSLKKDLTALFECFNPIFNKIRPDDLRDLISDLFSNMASYDFFSGINQENSIRKSIETIITRANHRNEISLSIHTLSEKALNLPCILIINEIVLNGTLGEESIEDIIDHILLPVYRADK